ncbi:ABC transporter permease [Rhodocytophaga aerolata]|uniref:ABC transporter permease n=1 Tax=Rhodocytophaga aerolata TaxID=455078 RepID=A0ABT8R3Y6_9BACT|nr:ABC transporter permease [Rhodocytophaga aerolata]MDO1446109.1 ABC transporter permease [Rhodocytophaga aerolata]
MIRHLLKLTWNRKRSNFLIMLEIFFAFLVLYVVTTLGVFYVDNYNKPLGFSYENVWSIVMDTQQQSIAPQQKIEKTQQLLLALKSFDEVEEVGGMFILPFSAPDYNNNYRINGRKVSVHINTVTDELKDVLDLKITRGRWFEKSDEAAKANLVVINESLSKELFGDQDPIGKPLFEVGPGEKEKIVVGVIAEFRKNGELAPLTNYFFERASMYDTVNFTLPSQLVIKLRPGTTAQFEEKLVTRLQNTVGEWSYEVESLAEAHRSHLLFYLTPLIVLGIIAAFLILGVSLGLIGVIWQNVTARANEIGLRRAAGATLTHIFTQILLELLLIASLGMLLGVLLVMQFPLLGIIDFISAKVYMTALVISVVFIYLVAIICGLYPSWLATKVQPTEALHAE